MPGSQHRRIGRQQRRNEARATLKLIRERVERAVGHERTECLTARDLLRVAAAERLGTRRGRLKGRGVERCVDVSSDEIRARIHAERNLRARESAAACVVRGRHERRAETVARNAAAERETVEDDATLIGGHARNARRCAAVAIWHYRDPGQQTKGRGEIPGNVPRQSAGEIGKRHLAADAVVESGFGAWRLRSLAERLHARQLRHRAHKREVDDERVEAATLYLSLLRRKADGGDANGVAVRRGHGTEYEPVAAVVAVRGESPAMMTLIVAAAMGVSPGPATRPRITVCANAAWVVTTRARRLSERGMGSSIADGRARSVCDDAQTSHKTRSREPPKRVWDP